MKTVAVCFGFWFAVLLSGIVVAQDVYLPQDVYKWVDADGVTHYAAQPPTGMPAERTGVRVRGTNKPALQARTNEQAAQAQVDNTRGENAATDAAANKSVDSENTEVRENNCEVAMQQQKTYTEARQLYRPLEDGGRDYLTSQELDDERAAANDLVEEWCD